LVISAIDQVIGPLPERLAVHEFEISLRVNSGNVIFGEFDDIEAAIDFMQKYASDPDAIRHKITPSSHKLRPEEDESSESNNP
jgi:hypothetical protein